MKQVFLFAAVLFCCGAFAQLDHSENNKSGKHIGREGHNIGKESSDLGGSRHIGRGFSSGNKSKRMFGQPDKLSLDVNKKNAKVNISKESEFISPNMKFEPSYLKQNEGKVKKEYSKPQDLGKFYSSGDFVKVSWRDAQVVDGDRVDIIINGKVVAHNVTLLAEYHSLYVDLEKGFTKIEFQALNQGESGPNTADFKVEADDGTVLTHNQWNLTTGTKAHLVIVKN